MRAALLRSASCLARRRMSTTTGSAWAKRESVAQSGGPWATNGPGIQAPTGLIAFCTRALTEYPLRTNALVAGSLGAAGDAAAQLCEYYLGIMSPGKTTYNWPRTVNMAVFGVVAGPVFSLWYRGLDKAAKAVALRYEPRLAIKIIADNLLAAPMMLHLYYGLMGALEGRSWDEIVENARSSFYKAWGLGVSVWIPFQFLNFHVMPVFLQPVVIATFDVVYKMGLSLLNHKAAYGRVDQSSPAIRALAEDPRRAEVPGVKAAPALQFEWPSPTAKLHLLQVANAELQQVIVSQQQTITELTLTIVRLKEQLR